MIQDYKFFLKTELENRIKKNPRYSLRKMASQIGVSASTLSDILNNKRACSLETGEKMAHFFEMSPSVKQRFLSLIKIDTIKNLQVKKQLTEDLFDKLQLNTRASFEQNVFEIISDWYHNAILALLKTEGVWNEKSIAHALGISIHECKLALQRLQEVRLIAFKSGLYLVNIGNPIVASSTPNAAIRKYHRQLLTKAIISLEDQMPSEKVIRTETLAFSSKDLSEVDTLIAELMAKLVYISRRSKRKNAVYHAGFQFFKLNK